MLVVAIKLLNRSKKRDAGLNMNKESYVKDKIVNDCKLVDGSERKPKKGGNISIVALWPREWMRLQNYEGYAVYLQ